MKIKQLAKTQNYKWVVPRVFALNSLVKISLGSRRQEKRGI